LLSCNFIFYHYVIVGRMSYNILQVRSGFSIFQFVIFWIEACLAVGNLRQFLESRYLTWPLNFQLYCLSYIRSFDCLQAGKLGSLCVLCACSLTLGIGYSCWIAYVAKIICPSWHIFFWFRLIHSKILSKKTRVCVTLIYVHH
jgi:hypothetical protein